jgi:hypothetical protein
VADDYFGFVLLLHLLSVSALPGRFLVYIVMLDRRGKMRMPGFVLASAPISPAFVLGLGDDQTIPFIGCCKVSIRVNLSGTLTFPSSEVHLNCLRTSHLVSILI